jgi:hypothetical protein
MGYIPFRFVIDDTFLIGVVKQSYLFVELCKVVSVSYDRDVVVEEGTTWRRMQFFSRGSKGILKVLALG